MIDGFFKRNIDPLWDHAATPLIRLGATPNQVTMLGLLLVLASAGAYLWHQASFIAAISLAIAFSADSLDGAVARRTGQTSHFGGYLDAMVDRYQEAAVLLVLAVLAGAWLPAMLALFGAVITSYAKARAALEIEINNDDWPDLFERLERVVFVCVLLVADGVYELLSGHAFVLLTPGLWLLALLTNLTAVQRMLRARKLMRDKPLER